MGFGDIFEGPDNTYYYIHDKEIFKLDSTLTVIKSNYFSNIPTVFERIIKIINDSIYLQSHAEYLQKGPFIILDTSLTHIRLITFSGYSSIQNEVGINEQGSEYFVGGIDSGIATIAHVKNNLDTLRCYSFFTSYSDLNQNLTEINFIKNDSIILLIANKFNSSLGNSDLCILKSDSSGNFCISNTGSFEYHDTSYSDLPNLSGHSWSNSNLQTVPDTIQNSNGLFFSSLCNTTSIKENSIKSQLDIYPNPTSSILNIPFIPNQKIDIYDAVGRNVLFKIVSKNNYEALIDISNFKPGLYWLFIQGKYFKKIVKY
jgi:hypothetical protein